MKIKSFEKPDKQAAELSVEISAEEFEEAVNQAYIKNKGKVNVPGFRKGHAPRKMIENMYGAGFFNEDAIEIIYPQAFDFAYDEEKFDLVGKPGIKDVKFLDDKSAEIVFQLWLYPTVKIQGYKGLSAPKTSADVADKEVEEEIVRIAERNARELNVDRAADNGDIVNLDYKGFLDDKPFSGGEADKYDLKIGAGKFVPGFEEQIVGMKAGEENKINIRFPDEYTPELAGKDVVFEVRINEVKERQIPEIDDEFAKDVSEFDTLEDYKNSIKEKMTEEKSKRAKEKFETAILDRVTELVDAFIPDVMINERIETALNNYDYRLHEQGLDLDRYLKMMGITIDQFAENIRPNALRDVKLDLAFEEIAKLENIVISDEEVDEEFERLAKIYDSTAEDMKNSIGIEAARRQLKVMRSHDLVIDSATEGMTETEGDKSFENQKITAE